VEYFSLLFSTFYNTLEKIWPMLLLFFAIVTILRISNIIMNHEHTVFYKEFYNIVFLFYLLSLYYLLLGTENGASTGLNLIPFREITRFDFGSKMFIYNTVGNIILFMPFGYFASSFTHNKKILPISIITILISLTAELIQYKIGRAFDIDDILLNYVGSILGFLVYDLIIVIKDHLPNFIRKDWFYNLIACAVLIGIAYIVAIGMKV